MSILAILSTGWGRAAAAVLMVIGAYFAGHAVGRHDQKKRDNVSAIKTELAVARADLAISGALAGIADDEARAADHSAAQTQDKIDAYEKALAAMPDLRCTLGADDVRRLRALAPAP
jgi:hypothetical protein